MAVYTRLTFEEIKIHLQENYEIGDFVSFQEIVAGIDNSNFIVETSQGKFILTIFEKRIKKEDLPFFMNFKLHLARNGILCPKPVLSKNNLAIIDLKGKKSAITTFLNGKTLQPRNDGYYDNITNQHCFEVGQILAKLHLSALDFKEFRKNDLGFDGFRIIFNKISNLIDDYQIGLKQEILGAIDFIEKNWQNNLPKTACHLDLFPDNVFFDKNQNLSGVIDFYFAACDFLIYDFAIIVNAWCFDENNNFIEERFLNMKNGYEKLRKFDNNESEFLKIALISASMRFLLTRFYDLFFTPQDSVVNVKNPQEYLSKMRFFKSKL